MSNDPARNNKKSLNKGSENSTSKSKNAIISHGLPKIQSSLKGDIVKSSGKLLKNKTDSKTPVKKSSPAGNVIERTALLNHNIKVLSMNARQGVDPELFFDASKDFRLSIQQLEQMLHISSKTIQNKIEKNLALGPVHSEHLLKLMALYMKGVELFRTVDEFNHWLNKPFWFNNEKPIDWLVTPGGIDSVMDELVKMAYGDAI